MTVRCPSPAPARCCVIAEAGVNHNGSLDMALALVDAAADAGADVVKFQTFRADRLATAAAGKAAYQQRTSGADEGQRAMLRRLELDAAAHRTLLARCAERGIEFMSTPFDEESLDLLVADIGVARLKLPSGEITNGPLLLRAARTGLPLILSTGMSVLGEIEAAVGVLAYGYAKEAAAAFGPPGAAAFAAALADPTARARLADRVTLLHCTTEYPAAPETVNLAAMDTLAAAFGLPIGYSDHTEGIAVPLAAAARGAVVIEKHFTLDRTLPGPDHRASLEPEALAAMVAGIRTVEIALGNGHKGPQPGELGNRAVVRKGLVAARPIIAGAVIGPDDITAKRPAVGASPMAWWDWVGRVAPRAFTTDEPLQERQE